MLIPEIQIKIGKCSISSFSRDFPTKAFQICQYLSFLNDGSYPLSYPSPSHDTIAKPFFLHQCHGYALEHRYSKDYNGMKNHYYLIQTGHMIAQLIENWKRLWENTRISQKEKHQKLLESLKRDFLKELYKEEAQEIQIRFN